MWQRQQHASFVKDADSRTNWTRQQQGKANEPSCFLLLPLPPPLASVTAARLSSSPSICSPFGIMMQLVTCRGGASCRHRRCCHRTWMGKGPHLRTKIEFGPRCLGPQPDVLLVRLPTAQHNIHLQRKREYIKYIVAHSLELEHAPCCRR